MQAGECPHCGAPTRALQEYCLECGGRLAGAPGVGATLASVWRPRPAWYPAEWAWPVLGLLAVAAVTLAAVLSVAEDDDPGAGLLIATRPATGPLLSAVLESAPTPTEPALPPQETVAPPRTANATPSGPIEWPPNVRNGWTVVLANLPVADGREPAVDAAEAAIGAGLQSVGILDSGEFASLHPGYFVVFVGAYDTPAEAQSAAERAQARGYDAAYIRQITIS